MSDDAARQCVGTLPKFSEGKVGLLPLLAPMLNGWMVLGWPIRVAQGLATVALPVPGLYEARQSWLDRHEISGGWREVHEACWRQADADLQAEYDKALAESMKKKGS